MTLTAQLMWGTIFLALCCVVHVALLGVLVYGLRHVDRVVEAWHTIFRNFSVLAVSLLAIVFSHTLQVWLWAVALLDQDQLSDWSTALYFTLVTYTSLGYGDVTLPPASRLFGAFASVTGLLAFGMSTAFLVAVMTRLLGTEKGPFHHNKGENKRAKGAP